MAVFGGYRSANFVFQSLTYKRQNPTSATLAYSQLPRKYKIYSALRKYRQFPLCSSLFTLICADDRFGFYKLGFHHC